MKAIKIFAVGLMAFCGIETEGFVKSGLIGCVLYACLIALAVTLFCFASGRKSA